MFRRLASKAPETAIVVLIHYKIRFEPLFYRETAAQLFGKKRISWHRVVNFYLASGGEAVQATARIVLQTNGTGAQLSTLFFDHIVKNETTQDTVALASNFGCNTWSRSCRNRYCFGHCFRRVVTF